MASKIPLVPVRAGQVWRDLEMKNRMNADRFVRVLDVSAPDGLGRQYATCQCCNADGVGVTHKTTRIRVDRMRPNRNGFELAKED